MSEHIDHGHTVAAWTAVTIAMLAFVVGSVGVVVNNWTVFGIGVAMLPVAGLAGKVLANMGYGKKS